MLTIEKSNQNNFYAGMLIPDKETVEQNDVLKIVDSKNNNKLIGFFYVEYVEVKNNRYVAKNANETIWIRK